MKKTFKEFLILDYFTAKKGNQKQMNAMSGGHTPLVSAKKIDNGYKDFVNVEDKDLFTGHCITLNNDGDGGAGMAFYQPADFALDTHVTALYPKQNLSKYQMIYIANCISKQRILFGHGRSINSSRLAHFICMLPVTPDGSPDFKFMEQYMQRIEKKLLKRYSRYLEKKGAEILDNNFTGEGNIDKAEGWQDFSLLDIFSLKATRSSIDKKNLTGIEGNVPYITRTDKNNGIDSFIGCQPDYQTDKDGVITIGLDTQSVFYQQYEFYTGQNIQVLSNSNINLYVASYLIPLIKIQLKKFNWGGNGATLGRLKKLRIMLPVTPDGSPDFKFMEEYMREKDQKIIHRYIEYRLKNV